MKRGIALSLLVALLGVGGSHADLKFERQREAREKVAPLGIRSYTETFLAHKRALAIASGDGQSSLGLYVFDAHGNCVAHDDLTTPQTADDVAVDWIPPAEARYDVEVRNGGFDVNTYKIALR